MLTSKWLIFNVSWVFEENVIQVWFNWFAIVFSNDVILIEKSVFSWVICNAQFQRLSFACYFQHNSIRNFVEYVIITVSPSIFLTNFHWGLLWYDLVYDLYFCILYHITSAASYRHCVIVVVSIRIQKLDRGHDNPRYVPRDGVGCYWRCCGKLRIELWSCLPTLLSCHPNYIGDYSYG